MYDADEALTAVALVAMPVALAGMVQFPLVPVTWNVAASPGPNRGGAGADVVRSCSGVDEAARCDRHEHGGCTRTRCTRRLDEADGAHRRCTHQCCDSYMYETESTRRRPPAVDVAAMMTDGAGRSNQGNPYNRTGYGSVMPRRAQRPPGGWSFVGPHLHVLAVIANDPTVKQTEIAAAIGLSPRRAATIVAELIEDGWLTARRDPSNWRRSIYTVRAARPFDDGVVSINDVSKLLRLVELSTGHLATMSNDDETQRAEPDLRADVANDALIEAGGEKVGDDQVEGPNSA
ncbi:MAG: AsnC family transcriptional regulator [Ilumatobacteraceae bacterium]|nr:AsnC family transcriptional regulator [Ilumatobacteraceae bacterium]